jgi:hypothetical protein
MTCTSNASRRTTGAPSLAPPRNATTARAMAQRSRGGNHANA